MASKKNTATPQEHPAVAAIRNSSAGKVKVFGINEKITPDMVMASACLPQIAQTVEIDGEPYWDGGFSGNPALWPLIYGTQTDDVLLVQINPRVREGIPRSGTRLPRRGVGAERSERPDLLDRMETGLKIDEARVLGRARGEYHLGVAVGTHFRHHAIGVLTGGTGRQLGLGAVDGPGSQYGPLVHHALIFTLRVL